MGAPVRQRPFHVFLSHAHANAAVVDGLYRWLRAAGLDVWYDAENLAPGTEIASGLGAAIESCRGAIVILSEESVASRWVQTEWNVCFNERNGRSNAGDFAIVPVRIDECHVPAFLGAPKWIQWQGAATPLAVHAQLLGALSGADAALPSAMQPLDVYVSCSWREGREAALPSHVCDRLRAAGARLIGDSKDWPSFTTDRIRSIMRSCSGVVSVVPNRGTAGAVKYFLQEIGFARSLDLPLLVVAEAGAALPPEDLREAVIVPSAEARVDASTGAEIDDRIQQLLEDARRLDRSPHFFMAVELSDGVAERNRILRETFERVTGMPCVFGERVGGDAIQGRIVESVRDAIAVVADISDGNLNVCIEAGVARGAGVALHLVSRGPRERPPFMLRDIEPSFYASDADLLAAVHRVARSYRRNVLR